MAARRRVPRLAAWTATAAVVAAVAATLAGSAPALSTAPVVVQVAARDFSFKLSRRSVPVGSTVRFVVRNRGSSLHDFVLKGRHTRRLRPGTSQTITIRFPKKGTFSFVCSVPGHARLGMKGKFGVGAAPPPAKPPPPVTVAGSAVLTKVATTQRPVLVTAPPGDTERAFIVDQTGLVWILRDGQRLPQPFLDLQNHIHLSSEPGLLSIAFPPDYEETGIFYVFYNSNQGNGDLRLSEYRRSTTNPDVADPYSERILLTIPKPWENHNGGMLQFGPDGDLYISVGDGDSGIYNPPGAFAQSRNELLGDILRIDPRHGNPYAVPSDNPFVGLEGVRPEIWAYGLRNPWRFWIDAATGDMYIGDAGEGTREEVDLVPKGQSGLNFGWPCLEGTAPFDASARCPDAVAPLIDIAHSPDVCAVIGGVVAHDPRVPALEGRYLYGDLCGGKLIAALIQGESVAAADEIGLTVPQLTSFGVDGLGRVYVMSLSGDVYRLDPK